MSENRKLILKRRPDGHPVSEDFALIAETLPDLSDGEILVRNHFISLDPAQRGWMSDAPSYIRLLHWESLSAPQQSDALLRAKTQTSPWINGC